jgi:hypothetical protein
MTTAISAAVPRQRVTVVGEVVATTTSVRPWVRFDVELSDRTGTVTLRFLGRTEIPGVVPGCMLRVEGTPSVHGETLMMLNPLYSFVAE